MVCYSNAILAVSCIDIIYSKCYLMSYVMGARTVSRLYPGFQGKCTLNISER